MKTLKNNISNNNSITTKTYVKAISLASLSGLVMLLAVNDIQKVNAMANKTGTKIFYGSNGARPIAGVHNGNSGVKPVPNSGKITTTPSGEIVTLTSDPIIKNKLKANFSNLKKGNPITGNKPSNGTAFNNKNKLDYNPGRLTTTRDGEIVALTSDPIMKNNLKVTFSDLIINNNN